MKKQLTLAVLCAIASQHAYSANDIEIVSGTNQTNVSGSPSFTTTDDSAQLGVDDITTIWNGGVIDTVSVTTDALGSNSQFGDITLSNDLVYAGAKFLILNAHNDIYLNGSITGAGLNVTLNPDSDALNGGVVNLNATMGDSLTITVNGELVIGATGIYNLVNVADSLTADSITKDPAGTFNYSAGSLTINSLLNIDSTGILGDTFTLNSSQILHTASQTIGTATAASGSLTQTGGTNTVDGALTVNAGGTYDLNGGSLATGSSVVDGSMNQTLGDQSVTGALTVGSTGAYALSDGTLSSGTLSTDGTVTQSGGVTTVTNALTVNAGGTYDLDGGSLATGSSVVDGSMNQTLGDHTVTGALTLGWTGAYTLSDGALNSDTLSTDGTVTQSGGVATVNNALTVNAAGSYDLGGGSLVTGSSVVDGSMNQTLGDHSVTGTLTVGSTGAYTLSGGTLSSDTLSADGAVTQSGGANAIAGQLAVQGTGSYTLSGGSLTAGSVVDTSAGSGFAWNAGDLTLSASDLAVDSTGLFGSALTLTSTKNLHTVNQTVGTATAASGSITQQLSSSNVVDGTLTINAGGTYTSVGGALTAGSVANDGAFTQSGSASTNIGALTVGAGSIYGINGGSSIAGSVDNSGAYSQSLGSNTVSGAFINNATGTFNLTKGTFGADSVSNSGAITQSGGTLSAGSVTNSGTFTQTGGSNSVSNALTIGAGGSYAMDVGTLATGSIDNSGAITQLGTVGDSTISTATLTMNAGSSYDIGGEYSHANVYCSDAGTKCSTLSTTTINNAGTITQTGGLVTSNAMTINNGGSYDQSVGRDYVSGILTVEAGGSYSLSGSDNYYAANYSSVSSTSLVNDGVITQSGGYNYVTGLLTVGNGASYTLSGGTLAADDIVRNGTGVFNFTAGNVYLDAGDLAVSGSGLLGNTVSIASGQSFRSVNQTITNAGSISQTGGSNTATGILTIDAGGSYSLNGGTLTAASVTNNGSFNYTSGSVQLTNSDLNVDSTGLLGSSLSIVAGESFDANNQTVGTATASSGSISQTGGTNNIDNVLTINAGGTYTMSGGNLIAGSVVNNGVFDYIDGGIRLTNSAFAVDSTGLMGDTINIVSGQTFGAIAETVGTAAASSGFVNQTGGSNTIDTTLTINAGGTYTMSGGSLVAGSIINDGVFSYTGGAVRLTNDDLAVDSTGLLGDTITIASGQTFGAVNQTVGTATASSGSVIQTGGVNYVETLLSINAGGSYTISGGSLIDSAPYNTTLSVNNSGVMTSTGGYTYLNNLTINSGGSYSLAGGSLNVNSIVNNGAFSFTSGSLEYGSSLTVGAGGPLGSSVSIGSGKSLSIVGAGNTVDITSGGSLMLNGGSLAVSAINNNGGTFTFTSGHLDIDSLTVGTGALLGNSVSLSSTKTLDVSNSLTINSGATVSVASGDHWNGSINNSGAVNIATGASAYAYGSYTQTNGSTRVNGTLTASTVSIQGGLLDGTGKINGDVEVVSGGVVNPGNSPGTLEISGTFTLSPAGTLQLEVGDTLWDKLIAGDYSLTGGSIEFLLIESVDIDTFIANSFSIDDFLRVGDLGTNYGYLESGRSLTAFDNLVLSAYDGINAQWYNLTLDATGGFAAVAAVPVPAAVWLFGSGLLGLVGVARRRSA